MSSTISDRSIILLLSIVYRSADCRALPGQREYLSYGTCCGMRYGLAYREYESQRSDHDRKTHDRCWQVWSNGWMLGVKIDAMEPQGKVSWWDVQGNKEAFRAFLSVSLMAHPGLTIQGA